MRSVLVSGENYIIIVPMSDVSRVRAAKFAIGQIVKHRIYPFRGVIYDVDPTYGNTEEWWQAIPEHMRPRKDQPFYHLFAENAQTTYEAYVSEQNLVPDDSQKPISHPAVKYYFAGIQDGRYIITNRLHS